VIYLETSDAGRSSASRHLFENDRRQLAWPWSAHDRAGAKEGLDERHELHVDRTRPRWSVSRRARRRAERRVVLAVARGIHPQTTAQLTVREGVVKGPTIAPPSRQHRFSRQPVRMSAPFVPMYGLNNMFGQIPIVGLFPWRCSNEGLIGMTYEVVAREPSDAARQSISMMAPGVLRKIFEFNTGKQNNQVELRRIN